MLTEEASPPAPLVSWMRLFRLPNIFTALADIAMGFLVVHQDLTPTASLVTLLLASACLYTAGMVLNDVFDVDQDRVERPQRPIPSGQISFGTARAVGFGLLALGVGLGAAAGFVSGGEAAVPWRSAAVAGLLAVCILLYDAVLKRTPVGPVFMGLCRFFNVLLGMSCASLIEERPYSLYYPDGYLLIAAGLGVYVLGITLFARTEAKKSSQIALTRATAIMGFGVAILLLVEGKIKGANLDIRPGYMWPVLLMILALSVGRHCVNAIADPQPQKVQWAVKFAILSIISLDAAVTLLGASPMYALGVFALVVPMMLLGRLVYST